MRYVGSSGNSLFKVISSKKTNNRGAIRRRLERIRHKLRSGARLTPSEKEFLRRYAPALYEQAMAMEREREAYEERLKQCRTKEDAERIMTEKMMEMAALDKEDPEMAEMRMAQTKAAEDAAASAINKKPTKKETPQYKKQKEIEKRQRENRERAEKKRLEEKHMDEKRQKVRHEKEKRDEYYEEGTLLGEKRGDGHDENAGIYGRPNTGKSDQVGEVITVTVSGLTERHTPFARGHGIYQAIADAGRKEASAGLAAEVQEEMPQSMTDENLGEVPASIG